MSNYSGDGSFTTSIVSHLCLTRMFNLRLSNRKMFENNTISKLLLFLNVAKTIFAIDVDPFGYVAYCPCMGRFGNQVDHFLGSLAFAHGLNRTLILPPWVEYRYGESRSIQVPFDRYFRVEPLKNYHKVITMEEFMAEIAQDEWPPNNRVAFCYVSRGESNSCNAKEGNPFGPFWDTYGVDFVASEFYMPLNYDVHQKPMVERWKREYPPEKWPVLAFTGAPASFPVQDENRHLQKYLKWSATVTEEANRFVETVLPKGAFLGIHLRNGIDWVRACEHVPQSPSLFSAPQCLGYRNEKGKATIEMCLPSKETIVRQLKRIIKSYNSHSDSGKRIRSIFVASDNDHMLDELGEALRRMKVYVFKYDRSNPHVDLAILGQSNHFVGNCISSYSAFVKRERDAAGFPSSFWAFPAEKSNSDTVHDEF